MLNSTCPRRMKGSCCNFPPYPGTGRRFLAKSDDFQEPIMEFPSAKPSDRHSGDRYAVQNEILIQLPANESEVLLSKLTVVSLELQLQLQEAGQPINFCYFPNTCM